MPRIRVRSGPHVDDYDVFLYQARGRRRWKIHYQPVSENDCIPGLDLRILPQFEAEQEWLLEPGDHALSAPQTGPLGCRRRRVHDLFGGLSRPQPIGSWCSAWCDELLERRVIPGRYRDPTYSSPASAQRSSAAAIAEIHRLLQNFLDTDKEQQRRWFGRFITETKPHLQVEPRPRP